MMPDLGRYAVWVLSAWGLSLALLAAIVALTLWRGATVRRALAAVEARRTAPAPAASGPATAGDPATATAPAPGTDAEARHG
jgi:heme exporter protein D